jgi:DsbC/DsbD-like thiol-disulfide interchange protein
MSAVPRRMTTFKLTRRMILRAALPLAAAPHLVMSGSALAADASAWSDSSHSALRLVAGGPVTGKPGQHVAAIHIRMNRGFKTYWRHPGDTGVPPVFRFDGSENLAAAEVRFPAPLAFPDGAGGHSFGYDGPEVMFPIHVTAKDPTKPVRLVMAADYAVCEKLCVPAQGQASLALPDRVTQAQQAAIAAADRLVPRVAAMATADPLAVLALHKGTEPEKLIVEVRSPAAAPRLFMEGEQPWFFETRTVEPNGGNTYRIIVAVIERSKAADCTGADVTLTLVSGGTAIEVKTRLDLSLVTP